MNTVLADAAKMIAKGALHVIHNGTGSIYKRPLPIDSSGELLFLASGSNRTSDSTRGTLRARTLPNSCSDAVSVLRFLIERQGLTQRELASEFGSPVSPCVLAAD